MCSSQTDTDLNPAEIVAKYWHQSRLAFYPFLQTFDVPFNSKKCDPIRPKTCLLKGFRFIIYSGLCCAKLPTGYTGASQ